MERRSYRSFSAVSRLLQSPYQETKTIRDVCFPDSSSLEYRSHRPVGAEWFAATATRHCALSDSPAPVTHPQAVSFASDNGTVFGAFSGSGSAMSVFGASRGFAPHPSLSEAELASATAVRYAAPGTPVLTSRPSQVFTSSLRCLPSSSLPRSGQSSRSWMVPYWPTNPGSPSGSGACAEKPDFGKSAMNSRSWSSRRVYAAISTNRLSRPSSPSRVRRHQ
ncbi:hypothetical protein ABTZ59_00140 [Streptomyces sp. NPDC094034]|uniref:hypothetical protein n=1 Tax=Streptomyces sp. NPDC094034 TaxID=3155309 RepID=UPI00332E2807